jgi:hypothetical protein
MSKFLELLGTGKEMDCELIIGNCEMPASFMWDKNIKITAYGIEKYKPIMNAEYELLENGNIEIFCDNYKLGYDFCYAAAGAINVVEYNKIFEIGKEENHE